MCRSITSRIQVLTVAVALGIGLAGNAVAQGTDSGYLKDYSQLQNERDAFGVERRIWSSPKLTGANYQKVLLERMSFYPAPEPSDKVSMGTLNDLRDYTDSALRNAIQSVMPLTNAPGPGVLRIRVAITAVSVQGAALKPYQYIPIALIFTAATDAAGGGTDNLKMFVESEVTDSVTGEPLARVVRQARGVEMKSNQNLTLDMAKPQIDEWAQAVQQSLASRLKSKAQ